MSVTVWEVLSALRVVVASLALVSGAFFCLSAAIGVVRFPDVITRLHAASKPQVLGLVLVLVAVALERGSWSVTALCVLVACLQVLTNPASAHMVARAAYRTGLWGESEAVVDDLADDLRKAGYRRPQPVVDDDLVRRREAARTDGDGVEWS